MGMAIVAEDPSKLFAGSGELALKAGVGGGGLACVVGELGGLLWAIPRARTWKGAYLAEAIGGAIAAGGARVGLYSQLVAHGGAAYMNSVDWGILTAMGLIAVSQILSLVRDHIRQSRQGL
jgi:hypothetical protein